METNKNIDFYNDPTINLVAADAWDLAKDIESSIKTILKRVVNEYVKDESQDVRISLSQPKDNTHGDYATNIALLLAGILKKEPLIIAQELKELFEKTNDLKRYVAIISIAGPGFINFNLQPAVLFSALIQTLDQPLKQVSDILKGKKILLEYAHPNPFKAVHIGHLRNIILGESILRLLQTQGAKVIPVNYQGDVGMHIAKCLWAFRKVPKENYPEDVKERVTLIAKCYAEGAQAFENEEYQKEIKEINRLIYTKEDKNITELWETGKQWSLTKFKSFYTRVYTSFEREYMESETLELCKKPNELALEKGILKKSEGAIIFDGAQYGLDTRVFMNSQGLPTYEGKELGLAELEFSDWGDIDLCIHNVAVEQISFFKVTFKVESLLKPEKYSGKQYHNAYEFVGLKSGKMSSRTGKVVLAEDILDMGAEKIKTILEAREDFALEKITNTSEIIGIGAIKYAFLNISSRSYLAFDIDKSISFDGNSGPYLQYTFARANKLLKTGGDYSKLNLEQIETLSLNQEEIALLKQLRVFKDTVIEATKHLEPNTICTYLFDLAQSYNSFYKKHQILKEGDKDLRSIRLMLSEATAKTLETGLYLLGIKTVSEM